MSKSQLSFNSMFLLLLLLTNSCLAAKPSMYTYRPKHPEAMLFPSLLYYREGRSRDMAYGDVAVLCGASLVAPRWLITTCTPELTSKMLIGVREVPRFAVFKRNDYNITRVIRSYENKIVLVEIDRDVKVPGLKYPTIGRFNETYELIEIGGGGVVASPCKPVKQRSDEFRKLNLKIASECVVVSWAQYASNKARKKLHCIFRPFFVASGNCKGTKATTWFDSADICLTQVNRRHPIRLCPVDLGAPLVCDGQLIGLIYQNPNAPPPRKCFSEEEQGENGTLLRPFLVTYLYPMKDWITFISTEPKDDKCARFNVNMLTLLWVVVVISLV